MSKYISLEIAVFIPKTKTHIMYPHVLQNAHNCGGIHHEASVLDLHPVLGTAVDGPAKSDKPPKGWLKPYK